MTKTKVGTVMEFPGGWGEVWSDGPVANSVWVAVEGDYTKMVAVKCATPKAQPRVLTEAETVEVVAAWLWRVTPRPGEGWHQDWKAVAEPPAWCNPITRAKQAEKCQPYRDQARAILGFEQVVAAA